MKICAPHDYGPVTGYELGNGYIVKPYMTTTFYLLGDMLIDTGLSHMRTEALGIVQDKKISRILLTHHHEDHSGNVAAFMKAKRVSAYGHQKTIEKMRTGFNILMYQHLVWGKAEPAEISPLPDVVESGAFSLVPIHAPGHSKDHTVFFEKNNGWLFSGDLYLASRIKYFRADESISDTMHSLRKVLLLDFDSLFCAHNPREHNGKTALKMKLDFLENFYGEIKHLSGSGYSGREIIKKMSHNEVRFVKFITFGNVSLARMIRDILRTIANEKV